MRTSKDSLLAHKHSKASALNLVEKALTSGNFRAARTLARESFEKHYLLSRTEKMLLCVALLSDVNPSLKEDTEDRRLACSLWEEATDLLPAKYFDETVARAVQLANIHVAHQDTGRALDWLLTSQKFARTNAARLHHNSAVEAYNAVAAKPSTELWA